MTLLPPPPPHPPLCLSLPLLRRDPRFRVKLRDYDSVIGSRRILVRNWMKFSAPLRCRLATTSILLATLPPSLNDMKYELHIASCEKQARFLASTMFIPIICVFRRCRLVFINQRGS